MTGTSGGPPRAVVIGIAVFAGLVLGLFGLIVVSMARRTGSDCPSCDAVVSHDPSQLRSALDGRSGVDDRAWHLAVIHLSNSNGGAAEIAIARLLLEHGADPNAVWSVGGSTSTRSTTQRAASRQWASAVLAQASATPDLVEALLGHGLDVKGSAGAEALVAATVMERTAVVARLLGAGVPPNREDGGTGPSALAHAIQTRNIELIRAIETAGGREW